MSQTFYLDYVGNGTWALGYDKEMSFPRYQVCRSALRLVQDFGQTNKIVMSEAAEIVLGDYQTLPHWSKHYFIVDKYNHPDCKM